jgi:hypothetical protein
MDIKLPQRKDATTPTKSLVVNATTSLRHSFLKGFYEESTIHGYVLALLIVASPFSAFAGELPQEGSYAYTACWSGVNNVITFSKTYTGSSYEMTASTAILPEACLIRALFAAWA